MPDQARGTAAEELKGDLSPAVLRLGPAALASLLAEAARAVPGVIRLEPTLGGQLRRWSSDPSAAVADGASELPDGLLAQERQGVVGVRVDIAIGSGRPADEVAAEVSNAIARTITETGRRPGRITVSVLAVEPD